MVRAPREDTDVKRELDRLPVGFAVVRIIRLLEHEIVSFDEVFQGTYCIFKGPAWRRKKAIERINSKYCDVFGNNGTNYYNELQDTYEILGKQQVKN